MSSNPTFDLVFEGGGAKGIAFVGSLQALEEVNYQPGRLLGTSAGAITATLIAAGYTAETILPSLSEKLPNGQPRFSEFSDTPGNFTDDVIQNSQMAGLFRQIDIPLIPERYEAKADEAIIRLMLKIPSARRIFSLIEQGGLFKGDAFLAWIEEKLNAVGGLGNATMAEMFEHTRHHLSVTAANVTDRRLLVLNHVTTPNLPVKWAVRMSMSVPFYWQEVMWDGAWGPYRHHDLAGHAIVDGGVLANFPMELLISKDEHIRKIMGESHDGILGCLIDESRPVPGAKLLGGGALLSSGTPINTLNRVMRLFSTMLQAHDKLVLEEYTTFVAKLPAKGFGTFEFDMTDERIKQLTSSAYDQTKAVLTQMMAESVDDGASFDILGQSPSVSRPAASTRIDSIARGIFD